MFAFQQVRSAFIKLTVYMLRRGFTFCEDLKDLILLSTDGQFIYTKIRGIRRFNDANFLIGLNGDY